MAFFVWIFLIFKILFLSNYAELGRFYILKPYVVEDFYFSILNLNIYLKYLKSLLIIIKIF